MNDFQIGDMLISFDEVFSTPHFSDSVKDSVRNEMKHGAKFAHAFCGMYVQLRYAYNHVVNFDENGRTVVKE